MASDGMWDFLDAEDVIDVLKTKTIKSPHDLSNSLFNRVMAKASEEANMSVNHLFNLKPGVRRSYYDDTTIVVFDLKH
jgi:serine/threonine protein phosphatase PrpC